MKNKINSLLATSDSDCYQEAFQLIIQNKELLKEVYPMVFYVLRKIDNSPFGLVIQHEIANELNEIIEIFASSNDSLKEEIKKCGESLHLLFSELDWNDEEVFREAISDFETYQKEYESILGKQLVSAYKFIVEKGEYHLSGELLAFYRLLIKYDEMSFENKVDFTEILYGQHDEDRLKEDVLIGLKYIEEIVVKEPNKIIYYYHLKGLMYEYNLEDEEKSNEVFQKCVAIKVTAFENNPVIKNLNEILKELDWQGRPIEEKEKYLKIGENIINESKDSNNLDFLWEKAWFQYRYAENKEDAFKTCLLINELDKEEIYKHLTEIILED
ncbi:hypothetical protein [Aureivirga sp. CE67]|uniref:hypothetical protein n=1 Tax=Aureivirga sp. CE67 TaxID=1788983 RepID=UPI0018CA172B|nr:hypothetical protein [Aureivirga sp. CE67]